MRDVGVEAMVVGLIMALFYLLVKGVAQVGVFPASWLWLRNPVVWVFVAGAAGHLALEKSGLNAAFCAQLIK